jgi:serine/threonine protein kinase
VLTCAPPHRLTAHVEEFTPLTEDSLLFDGPRTTYGRVRVLHQIGAGSVGPVFRGEDPANRQPVVVKVLRVGLPPERVAIVASALASTRERLAPHPALCPMLDSGVHEAEPFVVSAFVDGDSLDVALREYGPANITDALPRMRTLADALDSAAAAGITHGSLHLRDIIVSPEHTVLTGIGIVAVLERVGVRPPVRRPYCAPEIAQGHGVSPAGDQFALAAIAHEWLSGRRIAGPGGEGFHLPGTSAAGTEAVAAVFCRALDEAPEARFPTATAFIDALAEVSDALAPRARLGKRRPVPADEPRLAFDFLEDGGASDASVAPPSPTATDGDWVDTESPALSFATIDDDTDRVPADAPDEDGGVESPLEADDAVDDAIAAFEASAPIRPGLPMVDVMAAAPVDVTGPLVDLPDNPRPTEPVRSAPPPLIVRPPRVRPAAPTPMDDSPAAPDDEATDHHDAPSDWSAGRWALVLMVLAALAIGGGAALVRWGTPSTARNAPAPAETSVAASSPAPAASSPAPTPTPPATGTPAPAPPFTAPADAPGASAAPSGAPAQAPAPAKATPSSQSAPDRPRPTPPTTASAPSQAPAPAAVSRAPVPKAAPPRPAAVGSLLVRSTPSGAEVFVDGARRGVTPLAVRDLPLGAHAVRVARAGFAATEQRVTLDAGRPSRALDVTLGRPAAAPSAAAAPAAVAPVAPSTPGTLVIDSRPAGARVVIDGREHGRTPVTVPSLPPGDYAVAISLAGYQPVTTTTRVEPGGRARVAVSLTVERQQ